VARLWSEHLKDKPTLDKYASAMFSLATRFWEEDSDGRVPWCGFVTATPLCL
jgi:hypothetical protein